MFYYVLDLEYNQYFDFQSRKGSAPEPACPAEIIQMGVVVMDEKLNIKDRIGTLVRPQIFRRLHPHIQRLTGITMSELECAPAFPEAYESFFHSIFGKRAVFCTWGADDIKELYRNILYYDLNHKRLSQKYLNVQKLYGMSQTVKTCEPREQAQAIQVRQIGLKTAVESAGLSIERAFHNALSDAEYTAEILKLLLGDKSTFSGLQIQTLNINELRDNIDSKVSGVNVNLLYAHAEREMHRKLTDRDKQTLLDVYNLGRQGKFDAARGKRGGNESRRLHEEDNHGQKTVRESTAQGIDGKRKKGSAEAPTEHRQEEAAHKTGEAKSAV